MSGRRRAGPASVEHQRVPRGRAEQRRDLVARAPAGSRPPSTARGGRPLEQLQRRVVPDQLLHRGRQQAGLGDQPRPLGAVRAAARVPRCRSRSPSPRGRPSAAARPCRRARRPSAGPTPSRTATRSLIRSVTRRRGPQCGQRAQVLRRTPRPRPRPRRASVRREAVLVHLHDRVRPRLQPRAGPPAGTPSSSAITSTGSGAARCASRSADPSAAIAAASADDHRVGDRAAPTARSRSVCPRPNAAEISRRSRVWRGGSFSSSEFRCSRLNAGERLDRLLVPPDPPGRPVAQHRRARRVRHRDREPEPVVPVHLARRAQRGERRVRVGEERRIVRVEHHRDGNPAVR